MPAVTPPTPERVLRLDGATNFRDLGGYRTSDGRAVRWRTLFRSDHLSELSGSDTQHINALGLTRAFDFRGAEERAAASYELPGVAQHMLPIEPTVVQNIRAILESGEELTAEHTVELMCDTYRHFVLDNTPRFAELFAHMLDNDAPLLFHCTAGKDRTGFAAAMILRALDVPMRVVMQDYLLTNALYRPSFRSDQRVPDAVVQVLVQVQADFLEAALEVVERDFGGVDAYLTGPLGVDRAARRELARVYLTDASD